MLRNLSLLTVLASSTLAYAADPNGLPAGAASSLMASSIFGGGSKEQIKVANGGVFKDGSSFAIGSFRVTFMTSDEVVSVAKGGWTSGNASSAMKGTLIGLDHATMQKLADEVYADFLKQAAAKGLTIVESVKLAATSPSYKALATTPNYEEGRLGTIVIPTGQQSVPLPEDRTEKANKGSKGVFAQIKQQQTMLYATSDANKALPKAAKEAGMTILGVTMIVNFGDFKGATHNWGGSHVKVLPGATVDGADKMELLRATSILGWGPNTMTCGNCMAQVALEGTIHSDENIGLTEASKARKSSLSDFSGNVLSNSSSKNFSIEIDPAAYEKNVLVVTSRTTALMLAELGTK